MRNPMSGANISRVVKSLVNSVVRCGKEAGKVGGKLPVLPGEGSLRGIFFSTRSGRSDEIDGLEIFDNECGLR